MADRRSARAAWRVLSLILLAVSLFGAHATTAGIEPTGLEPRRPLAKTIAGGQSHTYRLLLLKGQYVYVLVEQHGIDVVVTLQDPEGAKLVEVDSPNGTEGPEPLHWIATTSGDYRVLVSSPDSHAPRGQYVIQLMTVRDASQQDETLVRAETAFWQARAVEVAGDAISLQKAVTGYKEAIGLLRELRHQRRHADVLVYLGRLQYNLGETAEAIRSYQKALPILRELGDRVLEASVLSSLGVCYNGLDEHQKALEYLGLALPLARAARDKNIEETILGNLGMVYSDLGDYRTAISYDVKCLVLQRAIHDREGEVITLRNLGTAANKLGKNREALRYYAESLRVGRGSTDRGGEALTRAYVGKIYGEAGNHRAALKQYERALVLAREGGDRRAEGDVLTKMGASQNALGESSRALDLCREGVAAAKVVGDRSREVAGRVCISQVQRDRGDLDSARSEAEATMAIVESLWTGIHSESLQSSYLASVFSCYETYIDVLMRLHRREPNHGWDALALASAEAVRARRLLQLLSEAKAEPRNAAAPELLDRQRIIEQELTRATEQRGRLLAAGEGTEQVKQVRGQIDALARDLEEIKGQIRANDPRYAALTQPAPLTPAQIQRELLDEDTLLLEYALGKRQSFVWAVARTGTWSFELASAAEIESAARELYQSLTRPLPRGRVETDRSLRAATRLSELVVRPVAALLKRRVVIVADGALQYVPFGVLPDRRRETGEGSGPTLLLQSHEIVTAPSASTLAALRRETLDRMLAPKTLAMFADPVFARNDDRVRAALSGQQRRGARNPREGTRDRLTLAARDVGLGRESLRIERLPFTRQEAKGILQLVPADGRLEALGFDANRTTATAPDLALYRLLHFATHGLLDTVHPQLSGLVLSLVDEVGNDRDGFLSAADIFNLRFSADLVVLSACRTALGKEIRGEGLVGLTRAFMYAGAPRVVASLWRVDDAATAELMKKFYQGMLGPKKLRPAAALREAQLAVSRQRRWEHPYYWAGFVLQGEWR